MSLFIFLHKEEVCIKYWVMFRKDVPISRGYMYLFILVKYLMHAMVESTLWTVLTECRDVQEMYTLKRVMHQSECTHPSLHLSLNLCVHSSV